MKKPIITSFYIVFLLTLTGCVSIQKMDSEVTGRFNVTNNAITSQEKIEIYSYRDGIPNSTTALALISTTGEAKFDHYGTPTSEESLVRVAYEVGANQILGTYYSFMGMNNPWFGIACQKIEGNPHKLKSENEFVVEVDTIRINDNELDLRTFRSVGNLETVYSVLLVELAKKGYWGYLLGDSENLNKKDYAGPIKGIDPHFRLQIEAKRKSFNMGVAASEASEFTFNLVRMGDNSTVVSIKCSAGSYDSGILDVVINSRTFVSVNEAILDAVPQFPECDKINSNRVPGTD